jgi:D-alanine-D-alanine ligase
MGYREKSRIWFKDKRLAEAMSAYERLGFRVSAYHRVPEILALRGAEGEDYFVFSHPSDLEHVEKLEELGFHIVGLSILSPDDAGDKLAQKRLFSEHGVPTPPYRRIRRKHRDQDMEDLLAAGWGTSPCVLKIPGIHGSEGVALAHTFEEIESRLKVIFTKAADLYVEPYLKGKDIAMCLMGEERPLALPSIEICHGGDYFSARLKQGAFTLRIPAAIDGNVQKKVMEVALRAYAVLGGHGIVRIDFRLTADGTPYVLEAVPFAEGLSPDHFSSRSARRIGISFHRMLLKHIEFSHSREKRKRCPL